MNQKIYNNASVIINKKTSKAITIWLALLFILLIISILIVCFYKYNPSSQLTGYVKKIENEFKVVVYLEKDLVKKFSDYKLKIDEQSLDFKITNISEEYYLIDSKQHYLVTLNIKLKDEEKIENNILNFSLEQEETTLLKELKKGWQKWKN